MKALFKTFVFLALPDLTGLLRLVKSNTVLPTVRHRCDISSKGAVLPRSNDTEIGSTSSLHASAYYNEYDERFDLTT